MMEKYPAEKQNEMTVGVRVSIHSNRGMGHLEVSEEFQINAGGFMEMCRILGQFQELATKIRGGNF